MKAPAYAIRVWIVYAKNIPAPSGIMPHFTHDWA
jgi:hypothetical protein